MTAKPTPGMNDAIRETLDNYRIGSGPDIPIQDTVVRPIFLRWEDKTFRVQHEDIVGFCVYEAKNNVGQKWLNVGLMRRDGSLVTSEKFFEYGVDIV